LPNPSGGLYLLKKQSKKIQAYYRIKSLIGDRQFVNSHHVSENSLASRLKMSRTPVREALQQLEMEGFIKIIPNKGIVVLETSVNEFKQIYDMRIAIEEFVLRELIGKLSDEQLAFLEDIIEKQDQCIESEETTRFLSLDRQFHEALFRFYDNPMIIDYMSNLRDRLYSLNYRMLQSKENKKLFLSEHRKILEALRKKDVSEAMRNMDIHLKGGKTRLI
jgi:DNA-binding GntR family transcriptional regulator